MWPAVRDYLSNSSFHGLHYLVDPGLHWTERLFWLVCILASWTGCIYVNLQWTEFAYQNPISLSVDTNYLSWEIITPTVVVCETNTPKLLKLKDGILREKFQQRIFFEYYLSGKPEEHQFANSMWEFKKFRSNCSGLFNFCSWQRVVYKCCEYFWPVETPMGQCFAMNSLQTNESNWNDVMKLKREIGYLIMEFKTSCIKIYAVSNDELVTEKNKPLLDESSIGVYSEYTLYLSTSETTSEPEVREIEIERRKCRFPDENYLTVSRKYSYDACKLQCQKETHLKMFNCTHHYMPYTDKKDICREDQLYNLLENSAIWREQAETNCYCDLGCIYGEVSSLGKTSTTKRTKELNQTDSLSHVTIEVTASSVKTIRKNAHSVLDNFVNTGGAAGLFVGASILSMVELVYFFTIRILDNILIKRRQRIKNRIKRRFIIPQPIIIEVCEVYPFVN